LCIDQSLGPVSDRARTTIMASTRQRLRGRTCDTCAFLDVFRSSGDGQVTRLHAFCCGPQSPHCAAGAHLRGLAEIRWPAPAASCGRSKPDRVSQCSQYSAK
jgi:hypothetical protein